MEARKKNLIGGSIWKFQHEKQKRTKKVELRPNIPARTVTWRVKWLCKHLD